MTNQPLSEKIIVLKAEAQQPVSTDKAQRYAEMRDMGVLAEDVKQAIQKTLKELKEEINKLYEGETEIGNDCLIVRKLELTDFIDTTFKQNFGDKLI